MSFSKVTYQGAAPACALNKIRGIEVELFEIKLRD